MDVISTGSTRALQPPFDIVIGPEEKALKQESTLSCVDTQRQKKPSGPRTACVSMESQVSRLLGEDLFIACAVRVQKRFPQLFFPVGFFVSVHIDY